MQNVPCLYNIYIYDLHGFIYEQILIFRSFVKLPEGRRLVDSWPTPAGLWHPQRPKLKLTRVAGGVINHGLPRRRLGCVFLIVDFPVNKHLVHLSCIIFRVFSLKLWYWNLHLIILGDPLCNRHTALRGVKRSGRVKLGWHLVIFLISFHFCWSLIMFKNLGIPETGTRRSFQPYKVSARPVIGCFLKPSNCSCVHLSTPKSFRTQSTEKTVKLVVNHRLAAYIYIWVYGVSLSIHHQPR